MVLGKFMKFVVNTNYQSAGTKVCVDDMIPRLKAAGHEVVRNDWENYGKYDIALFMAPDSDVRRAKASSPRIKCGIMDPKAATGRQIEEARAADFLLVSSVEQRDFFLKYNRNILIYYMFPATKEIPKTHSDKNKIIIGYHGNKQHLDAMADVAAALDELAKKYDIELWAIYNIEKLGKWKRNIPKICTVRHIQWSEENLVSYLSRCDIGIAPSILPTSSAGWRIRPLRSYFYNPEGYQNSDYVLRFKYSNNPGRLYVFSQLYVPVVADFTPSACQLIKDGESGFLVGTKEGWYNALEALILSAELRNKFSINLKKFIDENCSTEINFEKFLKFSNNILTAQ